MLKKMYVHLIEDIHAFHFKIEKERTQGEKTKAAAMGRPKSYTRRPPEQNQG
jgi:hypothetical protein